MQRLKDHIFYIPSNADTDRPVIGLISGSKHSLIVDGGNSPHHAREILAAIEQLGVNNCKYLALTHWHWDHVFGVHYINLLTICHELTQERLRHMQQLDWSDQALDERVASGEEIEFCSTMIKKEMPSREGLILGRGDITFEGRINIDLGGVHCIIENVGGDHGADCSIVYIPEDKVMFLGDCLGSDLYSGPRSYSKKALEMIEKIMKYEVETYISSHDEPLDKEEVHGFFRELRELETLTREVTSLEEALEKFRLQYGKEPNEDEAETLLYFVNGNAKQSIGV